MNEPPDPPPENVPVWLRLLIAGVALVMVAGVGVWALAQRSSATRPTAKTQASAAATPQPISLPTLPPVAPSTPQDPPDPTPAASASEEITGQTLHLLPIAVEEEAPDEESGRRLLLHVPIQAQPDAQIDPKALVIHVIFYDIVDGKDVVQTSARVASRWATPPANWVETKTEELLVEYRLPKPASDASTPTDRKYYGYIVRVYYQEQLQGAVAEPASLAQDYPAKPTLSRVPSFRKNGQAGTVPTVKEVDTTFAVPGVAAGAVLGLLPITNQDKPDTKAAKHLVLHIPIKARPTAVIDVKEMVIDVLFYDTIDGQTPLQASGNVHSQWATPPPNWEHVDTEQLDVDYQIPKLEPEVTQIVNRRYLGYIVRLYYRGKLQAAVAQPERLAKLYPPPSAPLQ